MKLSQKFLGLLTLVTIFSANSFACVDIPLVVDNNIHITARGLVVYQGKEIKKFYADNSKTSYKEIVSFKSESIRQLGAINVPTTFTYTATLTKTPKILTNRETGEESTIYTYKNSLTKKVDSTTFKPLILVEVYDPNAPVARSGFLDPEPSKANFGATYNKSGCSWNKSPKNNSR